MVGAPQKQLPGVIVNRKELANVVGRTLPVIDKYIAEGMPVVTRGNRSVRWEIDTAAAIQWLIARATMDIQREMGGVTGNLEKKLLDPRMREKSADAEMKELKLARERGEVVAIDSVVAVVEKDYAILRAGLMQMPTRVAAAIHDPKTANEVRGIITAEINATLRDLSAPEAVPEKAAQDVSN